MFEQFKIDGVDMSKLDYLLMQKRKSFYQLEKKKGLNVHVTGLIFTEEESISRRIDRSEKNIKIKMATNFDELEKFDCGHILECFNNKDILKKRQKTQNVCLFVK